MADSVREGALAQIRMQWWRDAADSVFGAKPQPHPVIQALREVGLLNMYSNDCCAGSAITITSMVDGWREVYRQDGECMSTHRWPPAQSAVPKLARAHTSSAVTLDTCCAP